MAQLTRDFERQAKAAFAADIETKMVDESGNVAFKVLDAITANLEEYAAEHGYEADSAIESVAVTDVDRRPDGISVRIESDHPLVLFAQTGTTDHTIRGNPVLSFVWERRHDPPQWVRESFEEEGDGWRVFFGEVEVSGLPEGRLITDALDFYRLLLTGRARRGVGA